MATNAPDRIAASRICLPIILLAMHALTFVAMGALGATI
jgi:hypothetical protein